MKKFLFVLCLIALITGNAVAQIGSPENLEAKNGFKYFILGDSISKYSDKIELVKGSNDTYSATDTTLLKIGDEIKLSMILIKTYNGRILSISPMAKPEYSYKMLNVFLAAYGRWSYRPNQYMDKYFWFSPNKKVKLYFYGEKLDKWIFATFTDMELDSQKSNSEHKKTLNAVDDL